MKLDEAFKQFWLFEHMFILFTQLGLFFPAVNRFPGGHRKIM